jgi:hypothetical protein
MTRGRRRMGLAMMPNAQRGLARFAALALTLALSADASVLATGADPALCAARPGAMLTSGDLGALKLIGDVPVSDLGLHGLRPHPIDAAFVGGRIGMWISTLALSGRYREESDAFARSLGYPMQELPLIPLVGSIVIEHPDAPLEVYEDVDVFTTDRWAAEWIEMARQNVAMQGTATSNGVTQPQMSLVDVALGNEAVAVIEPMALGQRVATDGGLMIRVRTGRTTVSVSVRGGPGLTVSLVQALAARAVARVKAECAR